MNRDEIHVIVRESKRVTICAKSEFRITNTDTDQMKKKKHLEHQNLTTSVNPSLTVCPPDVHVQASQK